MSYVVVCEDGHQRHSDRFATKAEAESWAWWGHVCTASHTIFNPDMTESELIKAWHRSSTSPPTTETTS